MFVLKKTNQPEPKGIQGRDIKKEKINGTN
jgi:hypothetical protein